MNKDTNSRKIIGWIEVLLIFAVIIVVIVRLGSCINQRGESEVTKAVSQQPEFSVDLLTYNDYSRPGITRDEINGIVIHYTANPGSTAKQNRDYFEGLKDSKITKASAHFIIGIDGEIIQCIPTNELAYASNDRNTDTIAIECCHLDESGEFTEATYNSLVELTAWLCGKFQLESEDIIRHYDITGKSCPLYYVENEELWDEFKTDVEEYINKYGEKVE